MPVFLVISALGLGLMLLSKMSTPTVKKAWSDSQVKAARELLAYVNKKGASATLISSYQKAMGISATGVPNAETERRVEEILGYDVYWLPSGKAPTLVADKKVKPTKATPKPAAKATPKPAAKATPKPAAKATPKPAAKATPKPATTVTSEVGPLESILGPGTKPATTATPKPATKATPKPATKVAPKALPASTSNLPAVPSVPDFVLAADSLDKYLRNGGLDRDKVRGYQSRIGGIDADGVAGPKTLARASKILGRSLSWPHIDAATDLYAYYLAKGRDKVKIKSYQQAMGELVSDGLVGPKTKARYQSLTGKRWS